MIRILVDSSADYTMAELAENGFDFVPFPVTLNDKTYLDTVELDRNDMYEFLLQGDNFPKTSQPSPEAFAEIFENAKAKGDEIICILLSSALSGTCQSAFLAKNIVDYRETNGRFTNRKQLLKVAKLGPKAFEQCAGFMRISGGDNPLDATSVHPESYDAAAKLLEILGYNINSISSGELIGLGKKISNLHEMAEKVGIGEITLEDIVKELEKPGRDPREEMPKPILRKDVLDMKDLKPGMILKGTVRNVIDFGAFVDIGVHQDGLVHISQMCVDRRVEHPLDVVSVGDVVDVRVIEADPAKNRVSLSMILDEKEAANRKMSANKGDRKNDASKRDNRKQGQHKKKDNGLNLSSLSRFMR